MEKKKPLLYRTDLFALEKGRSILWEAVRGGHIIPQEGDWGNSCLLSLPDPVSQGSLTREMMLKFIDQLQKSTSVLHMKCLQICFPGLLK